MRTVAFVARALLTVWLLALVYAGSRGALVIVLALNAVALELMALLLMKRIE